MCTALIEIITIQEDGMTNRRTKPGPSKKRAATRAPSGKGQTWLIAAIVLVALVVVSAGLWLIGARPDQSATAAAANPGTSSDAPIQQIYDLDQLPPGQAEHVEVAYFQAPADGADEVEEAPLSMQVPMWILIGATLYFGISATFTGDVAGRGAALLMGVAP